MIISCCIIVKDDSELKGLEKCVASVYPFVDGIYITANGSEVKGIKKFCKDKKLHYSYLKWDKDFSKMRNFNFSQAPQNSDFYFWLDADDVLIGGEHLRDVAEIAKKNNKDRVFFTYWYGCAFNGEPAPETLSEVLMEQMRERLLKPGTCYWKGRLHETPVPFEGTKNNYTSYPYDAKERPLVIMHTMEDVGLEDKMARNKEILELQLNDERKNGTADPRTLLYLMKIYAEKNEEELWNKVYPMGEEYLSKSGWNEERATCLEQMGIVATKLGDYKQATIYFHQAISEWPHQPLLYIRLATAYYQLGNYDFAHYWMYVGANMEIDNKGSNLTNIKAMKLMFTELLLKMNYNVKKDTKASLEAARMLLKESPTKEHEEQVNFLEDVNDLNDACANVDKLAKYLASIGAENTISEVLDVLPEGISTQPFAIKLRQQFTQPRKWDTNEICYFANFGKKWFEQWDSSNLDTGIGGSETAIIELSKEWTKLGYKVTVFGDPITKGVDKWGINWLPWYYFNPKDYFNIFIQWRSWTLADKIKCRKFLVDLHDIWNSVDVSKEQLNGIDKFMVKSKYHRELADLSDDKFEIIGNGVRL